jgi:hypothetical protein
MPDIPDYSAKFLELENLIKNIKIGGDEPISAKISPDDLDKLKAIIKETTKKVIKETPVVCESGNCPDIDVDLKPEAIDRITERITEQIPTIITNKILNPIVASDEAKNGNNFGIILISVLGIGATLLLLNSSGIDRKIWK